MQIYFTVTPTELQSANRRGRNFAHAAYRIGTDSTLLRRDLLLQTQGGLLVVNDKDAPTVSRPEVFSAAVLRECGRRNYHGVLLDFEDDERQDLFRLITQLEKSLRSTRRTLYIPERFISAAPGAVALLCTAMSGGNFNERLREAVKTYGAEHVALDIQRLCMDFCLPAPSGEGRPVSPEEFQKIREEETPSVFFSPDLCARYFTWQKEQETHFLLFDDAETLKRKLRAAAALGLPAAFFLWPEVADIAEQLNLS